MDCNLHAFTAPTRWKKTTKTGFVWLISFITKIKHLMEHFVNIWGNNYMYYHIPANFSLPNATALPAVSFFSSDIVFSKPECKLSQNLDTEKK